LHSFPPVVVSSSGENKRTPKLIKLIKGNISSPISTMVKIRGGEQETVGFAKLQGEDFEYYMQTYSIVIGRSSKKLGGEVDVDLSGIGGGMNISRRHARIFYDFSRKRFALEVLGKNGCYVEGVLHVPGSQPVKLDSKVLHAQV
jgi:FHA domain